MSGGSIFFNQNAIISKYVTDALLSVSYERSCALKSNHCTYACNFTAS